MYTTSVGISKERPPVTVTMKKDFGHNWWYNLCFCVSETSFMLRKSTRDDEIDLKLHFTSILCMWVCICVFVRVYVCIFVFMCIHWVKLVIFLLSPARNFSFQERKKGKRKIYFHLIVPAKIKLATQLRHTLSQR